MVSRLFSGYFNRSVLFFVLVAFSFTEGYPLNAQLPVVDIVEGVQNIKKIRKLLKKLNSLENGQDLKKLVKVGMQIKTEVEQNLGYKLDISACFDNLNQIFLENGVVLPHDQLHAIKKLFKKKCKRKTVHEEREIPEVKVDYYLSFCVVTSLVGLFLCVPLPTRPIGVKLVEIGATATGGYLAHKCNERREQEERERNKEKSFY